MRIESLGPPGLMVLFPQRFGDSRGWFEESWSAPRMQAAGLFLDFVQDNHARSGAAGTLRGLHYQAPPFAQTKLVRCTAGRVYDVAVDARRDSPTYGQWRGVELSAENGAQLLAPRGFLHGYLTLTPDAEVQYKVDAVYDRASDGGVAWDDPDIGIAWPLAEAGVTAPILSDKDAAQPAFKNFDTPFDYDPSP